MNPLRRPYPGIPMVNCVAGAASRNDPRLSYWAGPDSSCGEGGDPLRRRRRRRRIRRSLICIAAMVLLAFGVGTAVGFECHRTEEELAREIEGQSPSRIPVFKREVDRLISEMWKTEAVDRINRRP